MIVDCCDLFDVVLVGVASGIRERHVVSSLGISWL
jgi:hypothetical protein